ncbi:TetR/AcrR family transcriptional regulator [Parvibaculum sp.]|uniref:TetR/AcrR family transcriptional regulator n=1 Tax=Parvibaculum sp. TaxID=2024848 RepID=UPI002B96A35C|nr:TetR/AcrR family transcriptional regulator [Parvibaculum sp.]HUD50999.1 TetR/AcrR family transcriptional regulator [Parvibaculum sp.]
MSLDDRIDTATDRRRTAQRAALLDAASEMLMRGGPDAISLRKLASNVGTSTMAVYTAFGGKEGLIAALFEEAFDRLSTAQNSVPRDKEPLVWLANLGRAYRRFALENPSYYALMISVTMPVNETVRHEHPDYSTPPARAISRHSSYQNLLEAIQACVEEGSMPADIHPAMIADAFWATVHGLCSLELAGFYRSADDAGEGFALTCSAVLKGLLTPKGLVKLEALASAGLMA